MVQAQLETRTETAAQECRHHWVIDSAKGPVSSGKCRACGLEKQFKNYLEATPWGEDPSPFSSALASRYPVTITVSDEDDSE
jgi:hypothetical protein